MKNLKILFLYPNLHMRVLIPGGISILSACLKRGGFNNIQLFDPTWYEYSDKNFSNTEGSRDHIKAKLGLVKKFDYADRYVFPNYGNMYNDFRQKVITYNPDLIITSLVEDTYEIFLDMMKSIEDLKSNFTTLVGGVFPTSAPEIFESIDMVDYLCRGEGEEALVEFCNHIENGTDPINVQNIWTKRNGKWIQKNALRLVYDVDKLPIQDLSIFDDKSFYRAMMGKIYRVAPVESQRGCPFGCKFCNSPEKNIIYNKEKAGKFYRKRKIESIREELLYLRDECKIEYIFFTTDTMLAMEDDEFDEFCDMYSEFKIPFFCHTRPETITEYRAKRLKEIGVSKMNVGVEHGNEEYRKRMIGRVYKNEIAIEAFQILKNYDISTTCNFIIGYPDETRELIFDSINLARKLCIDDINAFIFAPYHGTLLRSICEEKNYLKKSEVVKMYYTDSMLNMHLPFVSRKEIAGLLKTFSLYVRLHEKYWDDIKKCESNNEVYNDLYEELLKISMKPKDGKQDVYL